LEIKLFQYITSFRTTWGRTATLYSFQLPWSLFFHNYVTAILRWNQSRQWPHVLKLRVEIMKNGYTYL
jgi:hypothetical protein